MIQRKIKNRYHELQTLLEWVNHTCFPSPQTAEFHFLADNFKLSFSCVSSLAAFSLSRAQTPSHRVPYGSRME